MDKKIAKSFQYITSFFYQFTSIHFRTAISPDTNEKIKMQHKLTARIVHASENEQPKDFEKLQKVTNTIERY